jgi:hypothetical protein
MKLTLVVPAAGWSARSGELKQVGSVGEAGETILDQAPVGAGRSGFGRPGFGRRTMSRRLGATAREDRARVLAALKALMGNGDRLISLD